MPFARHQRNSQRSTFEVVITGDGVLVTSDPNSLGGKMSHVRTGLKMKTKIL